MPSGHTHRRTPTGEGGGSQKESSVPIPFAVQLFGRFLSAGAANLCPHAELLGAIMGHYGYYGLLCPAERSSRRPKCLHR